MAITDPKISVVMPAYNAGRFIGEAIDSILRQTYDQFELIIINDGSVDDTAEIVRSFADARIRFTDKTRNSGLVAVRNLGMLLANGKYIALLDADDVAYPERFFKQVDFLENNPEVAMIGSNMEIIDENGRLLKTIRYPATSARIPSELLFGNYFAQSAMMIRRDSLPTEMYRNFPGVEDYDLWIRIADTGKVWNLQETLVKYRTHDSGITQRKEAEIENHLRIIVRRNLERLGLSPTNEELDIHRSLDLYGEQHSLEFVNQVELWLLKLHEQNENKKLFNSSHFRNVIGEKWFYSCLSAKGSGLQTWRIFSGSPLRRFARLKLYQSAGLFVFCLAHQFHKSLTGAGIGSRA